MWLALGLWHLGKGLLAMPKPSMPAINSPARLAELLALRDITELGVIKVEVIGVVCDGGRALNIADVALPLRKSGPTAPIVMTREQAE